MYFTAIAVKIGSPSSRGAKGLPAMKVKRYDKPAHNETCQRIKHDHSACSNMSGDPGKCASGCTSAPCREDAEHVGGDHLNPRSEHYDGPILPGYREGEAWRTILAVLPDTVDTRVAVHHLVEAYREAERQAVACRVDRDRGIREALARAEDCATHGPDIRELVAQVEGMNESYRRAEAARLVLLGFLHQVESLTRLDPADMTVNQLMDGLTRGVKKTSVAHTRTWSK